MQKGMKVAMFGVVLSAVAALSAATPDMYVDWVGNAADASCYVNQYVETGVNAQSGTKADLEMGLRPIPRIRANRK